MKQKSFFKVTTRSHGSSLSVGKRRSSRPIHSKNPIHIVLRSDLAKGPRSLLKNSQLVRRITLKASRRFKVQVFEKAICGKSSSSSNTRQIQNRPSEFFPRAGRAHRAGDSEALSLDGKRAGRCPQANGVFEESAEVLESPVVFENRWMGPRLFQCFVLRNSKHSRGVEFDSVHGEKEEQGQYILRSRGC